jgi:5-hydroxyisourate hydrolase
MARISTHVLDTAHGRPAAFLNLELAIVRDGVRHTIKAASTNADGRTAEALLSGEQIEVGIYELEFHVADYFRRAGVQLPSPPFLDRVTIRFGVADPHGHFHVPLLVSPYSYSTYRGS